MKRDGTIERLTKAGLASKGQLEAER
jgi:hypothetical protein